MAFELGIDFGCVTFGSRKHRVKAFLVLERNPYDYKKAISDISGTDIFCHKNSPAEIVKVVRNWLKETSHIRCIHGPSRVWSHYNYFMADFYKKRTSEGFSRNDI
jgi:hypothetical protein